MKKKTFRGFTLIECIVAMAILAISSLLLVQAYTQLMKVTNMNNTISMSIADQMADAEANGDAKSKLISGTAISSNTFNSSEGRKFTIQKLDASGNVVTTYATNVDVYCVRPYKNHTQYAQSVSESDYANGADIRYIYFHR